MTAHRPASPDPSSAGLLLNRIARLALLSVLLGFAIQGAILLLLLSGGASARSAAVQAAGGVTWAVLVCTGVGIGTVLTRARPAMAGLLAAAVAPASIAVVKAGQKAMSGWIGAAQSEAVLSLGAVSLIRAVEYGLLGWLLSRLVAAGRERLDPYLAAGAVAGLVFGSLATILTWRAAAVAGEPLTDLKLAATVVNEMVFPMGCAFVIYLGQEVGRSLRVLDPGSSAQVAA